MSIYPKISVIRIRFIAAGQALALLGLLTACGGQGGGPPQEPLQAEPPAADGFVRFNDFIASVRAAASSDFLEQEASTVASAEAFEEMKAHLEDLYQGVQVGHSFVVEGDVPVDCVPFDQQPGLRQPGMEDHEIQSPPPAPPAPPAAAEGAPAGEAVGSNLVAGQDRFGNERACPEGSFPMRRITLDEMNRFATLRDFLSKSPGGGGGSYWLSESTTASSSTHYYAHAYQHVNNTGAYSFLNLWSPTVASGQMSLSQQWVVAGSGSGLQTVEGGWQVYPNKYGTNLAVPFIFWTSADYSNGCYNLDCKAFIQTNSSWVLGAPWPSSSYSVQGGYQGGYLQYWLYTGGNWWLYAGSSWVGYYPGSLYGSGPLAGGAATTVDFGGEDTGSPSALQMGSGQFASGGFTQAAYQAVLYYYNSVGSLMPTSLTPSQHWPSCYTIDYYASGLYFYFGGPSCN